MALWRIHLKTDSSRPDINIAGYCIEHHIAGMGWNLEEIPQVEREAIKTFEDFDKYAKEEYDSYSSVTRLARDVDENDLIWMRYEGKYYLARVKADSQWRFAADQESRELDLSNQLTNIDWYPASENADESSVPGVVTTAFIKGSTFQRIKKSGLEEYSQMLYNHIKDPERDSYLYPRPNISLQEADFFNLLQPSDLEDILCMWLFKNKGYVCIPSTNKLSTQLYECVLIDPDTVGKNIYIQVKKGNVDLNARDYSGLSGEVYLLTTGGTVTNGDKYENIFVVNPSDIFNFSIQTDNQRYLPENIRTWVGFLSSKKGIIFDTNLSYSDTNEMDMLTKHRICAYGDADRYIYSFQKDDYALFYSKGKGIVAIGRIKDDGAKELEDEEGLYHDVEMLVPSGYDFSKSEKHYLNAHEISGLLNHGFYYASTMKVPFLDDFEVQKLRKALAEKYEETAH